ncbi:hypothetical protein HPB48_000536 [Haemaphysalis longicornis]|uniref:Tick transposon n=1 Tax=Haemaphysalis longicornis TaxID=44386 RepID=A0A9J6FEV7_HAELO|nr:hypothetical protein HPB48_000536 [Haemaphysalis longicornis]
MMGPSVVPYRCPPSTKKHAPNEAQGQARSTRQSTQQDASVIAPHRVAYTDAALVCAGEVVAVACTGDDNSKVAIALAIIQHPRYIYTDSQDACRGYLRGRICPNDHPILATHQPPEAKGTISIICTLSHTKTEVRGNSRAHHLAREEASAHAIVSRNEDPEERLDPPTPLTTFRSIRKHYREQRRTLPPPHHLLGKGEQVKWLLLQGNTYSTSSRMNLLYPQLYPSPTCPNCQQARGTIYHMVLACPNHPAPQGAARLRDHPNPWETAIRASDAEGQRQLISLPDEACRTNGTVDVGTSPD